MLCSSLALLCYEPHQAGRSNTSEVLKQLADPRTTIRSHSTACRGEFSLIIVPLRLKPVCCLRKQLSSTAYVVRTTSYFFISLGSVIREAPCQTSTSIPVVCASISLRHCIIATVGLHGRLDRNIKRRERKENENARHNQIGFRGTRYHESDHLDRLTHPKKPSG